MHVNNRSSEAATQIAECSPEEYPYLVDLWERSVRHTHGFVAQEDILYYKSFIADVLSTLQVYGVKRQSTPLGFLAINGHRLEMLFIDPDYLYQGLGRLLMTFAFEQGVTEVEVNEQNEPAVRFYHTAGFEVIERQPLDGFGKPYPILLMRTNSSE